MMPTKRLALTLLGVAFILIFLSTLTIAGLIQLKNDNGEFYQGSRAGRFKGDIDGAVFTPQADLFPITVQSVEFAFHRPRGAEHIGESARVRVQVYAIEDGEVGDILAESEIQTFSRLDEWLSLPFANPLTLQEPASLMAAVKWESGTEDEPAPSLASDSNLSASQAEKDRVNLYHDANPVLGLPPCRTGFCKHSEFWGDPDSVGFNMIRVTIDTPQVPTETPGEPTPTVSVTVPPRPTPYSPDVYLPTLFRNFHAFIRDVNVGNVAGEAVSYGLTSGNMMADRCWPGVDNNLWVGREPVDERGIMRSVIRFDLSGVPPGAVVFDAGLRLVAVEAGDGDAPMTVSVHDIAQPWAGCPTWNTLPDAIGRSWASVSVGSVVEVYTVDVTALVDSWLNGGLPNYGLMLRGDEQQMGRIRGFVPTASTQEDLRPSLIIKYR
ncbi:MAG: DNRLRE domain-containing protein [Anaerolineae bacterium]